ncbi:hypothetical protein OOT46_25100 [Aquabacterium sp. A7-Y]|uniref:hypothetical protein n=1 Tax=Aquabacterium sp. A7-Y TaxID=1349605 RepID=UPI00223E3308|nr:hypothetical protein [Aquabacterium sp. A7-Y]MCW7541097.1 hypothetical protein [Aquabacterium sp. A7-Y]
MAPVYRPFYISRSSVDPRGPEPRRILKVATARNAELGVIGLLFCSGDRLADTLARLASGAHPPMLPPLEALARDLLGDVDLFRAAPADTDL